MEGVRFIHLSRRAPAAPSFMPRPAALGQPAGLAVPETPCKVHGCPEPPVTLQVPSLRNAAMLHPTTAGHTHTTHSPATSSAGIGAWSPRHPHPIGSGWRLSPTNRRRKSSSMRAEKFPSCSLSKNICEKQNLPRHSPCPSLPDWYPISLPFWNIIERDPAGLVLQQRSVAITGPWLERGELILFSVLLHTHTQSLRPSRRFTSSSDGLNIHCSGCFSSSSEVKACRSACPDSTADAGAAAGPSLPFHPLS